MKIFTMLSALCLTVLTGCTSTIQQSSAPAFSPVTSQTASELIEQSKPYQSAFPGLANLCDLSQPVRDLTASGRKTLSMQTTKPRRDSHNSRSKSDQLAPAQVFSNLYFVGNAGVSAWILKTADGLILIDALNNTEQAKSYIEQGMLTLGLDPADLKYIVITHEHGDHYGGQQYLVDKYGAQVMMSKVGWQRLSSGSTLLHSPRWGAAPDNPATLVDGDILQLGKTQVQFISTPGHTPGTLSLLFNVYDGKEQHTALLWGGSGLNYGPDIERISSYSRSAYKTRAIAAARQADVFLSNHPARDQTDKRLAALHKREDGAAHPFVSSPQNVQNGLTMLGLCTRARALQLTSGH